MDTDEENQIATIRVIYRSNSAAIGGLFCRELLEDLIRELLHERLNLWIRFFAVRTPAINMRRDLADNPRLELAVVTQFAFLQPFTPILHAETFP